MSAEIHPKTRDGACVQPTRCDSPDAERVVRVGSPASLLALVPNLLGFVPADSVVVIGVEPQRGRVLLTLRFDLPPAPDAGIAGTIAQRALGIFASQGIKDGLAVGYGPGPLVTPLADAFRSHAAQAGFRLIEVLRAHDGRYWSYVCTDPTCCPPEGVPYDAARHPITAGFSAAGAPPVLANREELAATVAALDGEAANSMRQATRQAVERAAELVAAAENPRGGARKLIAAAGLDAVRNAMTLYQEGGCFRSDADAAWLSLVLRDLHVRDDAWARMDPDHAQAHLRLWTDLTRRAQPGYVAAPASLLAFVAWQAGNGALANVALDRAQADDPGYTMAALLREVIDGGAPPRLARLPMTPDEVAASYEEAEDDANADADTDDADYEAEPCPPESCDDECGNDSTNCRA
jgi:hypothetical protein